MSDTLIVIPSYISKADHARALNKCIKSIKNTTNNEVMIIDDCSPYDEQAHELYSHFDREYSDIEIIHQEENKRFSTTVNVGLKKALEEKRDAVLVNADIEFTTAWLEELETTEADIVGAKLLYPNNLIQHAGIYFSIFTRNFDHMYKCAPSELPEANVQTNCPVTGALQYLDIEVLESVGLYDEEFKLGYEDVDFNIRAIKQGFTSVYNPKVVAYHYESLMRGNTTNDDHYKWQKESYATLILKHKDASFHDVAPTMMEKNIDFH